MRVSVHHNNQHPKNMTDDITFWLNADGSLTALLEAKAGQPLRVERTFEGYKVLSLAQKKQFGYQGVQLNRIVMGWVREVLLYGNSESAWVAAQSIFPLSSLRGEAKRLQYLRGTPIGYVLFKRQAFLPCQRYIEKRDNNWLRRTLYSWHGRRLMISETFLPEFFESSTRPNRRR